MNKRIEHHAQALQREFAAGRMESARWHCQQFTALMRDKVFNDGTGAPGQHISSRAGAPSPNQARNAQICRARNEDETKA